MSALRELSGDCRTSICSTRVRFCSPALGSIVQKSWVELGSCVRWDAPRGSWRGVSKYYGVMLGLNTDGCYGCNACLSRPKKSDETPSSVRLGLQMAVCSLCVLMHGNVYEIIAVHSTVSQRQSGSIIFNAPGVSLISSRVRSGFGVWV